MGDVVPESEAVRLTRVEVVGRQGGGEQSHTRSQPAARMRCYPLPSYAREGTGFKGITDVIEGSA
ncbi:protein of unknown function [Agrobacterium pusense]|uniref:Uncharacterized protein n=1 Tax=Agrobacterium pusense TaxID=648995 RepID=U4Q2C0_9HYPH|nr:protein of unknown function [Agrobacterium pusense]